MLHKVQEGRKTLQWDTLHKEGVPLGFDELGFMLFSYAGFVYLPYGVESLLPYLRD